MPLFRFHRGGLEDSLLTTVIVKDLQELMYVISHRHEQFIQEINLHFGVIIGPYPSKELCFDRRIGWYTQMVTSDILQKGVFTPEGFLSEPFLF